MKILFAVSNENVSNKIVDSYRKKYGEAVSFKNVFYFNAIIREIQKDKTYDRIVVSEDLEPFSNNNYDVIDRFIIERLQEISYEARNAENHKIDIIVICTDRRTKSSFVLSKMFEYRIYNALVGSDRRIDNVCDLIHTPRTEIEAENYYKIEMTANTQNSIDDVSEQEVQNILIHYKKLGKNEDRYTDSFNNIAAQYTDKQLKIIIKCLPINVRAVLEAECPKYQELVTYAEETEEEKKQKEKIQEQRKIEQIEQDRKLREKIEKEKRESIRNAGRIAQPTQNNLNQTRSGIDLLDNKRNQQRMTGNVIIPNNMNVRNERKIYTDEELEQIQTQPRQQVTRPQVEMPKIEEQSINKEDTLPEILDFDDIELPEKAPVAQVSEEKASLPGILDFDNIDTQEKEEISLPGLDDFNEIEKETSDTSKQAEVNVETVLPGLEDIELPEVPQRPAQLQMEEVSSQPEIPQEPKRGRGRPRKYPIEPPKPKGKRGRPRKNPLPEETISKVEEVPVTNIEQTPMQSIDTLPGLDTFEDVVNEPIAEVPEVTSNISQLEDSLSDILPGLEDIDSDLSESPEIIETNKNDDILSGLPGLEEEPVNQYSPYMPETVKQEPQVNSYSPREERIDSIRKLEENKVYSTGSLNTVLTKDKKIVAFVGASKSGTSFLVNNLACLFSSIGVKTAILDMTRNKNSYYIYTNNDEKLRNIAYTSIEKLEHGDNEGIKVDRNLDVYTAIPNDGKDYSNAEAILSTLVQNESLILIDCDFDTDLGYFANSQEIYLVQSMDILTIQPLTGFLRDLKTKGILEQEKLRVVINKELKVKNLSSKAVIGGMSFYNDPAMSYMTELFNKDKIKACIIPFDENVYSRYLEAIVNCMISINGYPKGFMNNLKMLGNMVYPLLSRQTYTPNKSSASMNYGNSFSTEMNNTLNQMRNKY